MGLQARAIQYVAGEGQAWSNRFFFLAFPHEVPGSQMENLSVFPMFGLQMNDCTCVQLALNGSRWGST